MAIMSSSLYHALKEAKVTDSVAQKAAEDMADFSNQLHLIRLEIANVRAEQLVQRWMLGIVIGGIVSLMLKSFF